MLDLKFIRDNIDIVKEGASNKNEQVDIDKLIRLDEKRRSVLQKSEELKNKRNKVSKEIALLNREGKKDQSANKISEMKEVAEQIKILDAEINDLDQQLHDIRIWIPNMPHSSVPVGKDSSSNVEYRRWGNFDDLPFPVLPHWELSEKLEISDFSAATKLSGAGFACFKAAGAKLERALINFMLDLHVQKHGYTEFTPPVLVKRDALFGTGQLPKLEADMYLLEEDDLFLIPTAEVPVTNIHRDSIIKASDLPLFYTAYTPNFRREAGSYGKDTKGLTRLHQFDKVEMVKFVKPDSSYDELEKLLENAEEILQLLNLPYRVMTLCSGDLSFAAAKCYDIEVWAKGEKKFLEVSSCSNFEDFQARRASIRYREGKEPVQFVHTLNGSGLALPRTFIALLENYQTEKGTILIPEVLQPYMGGLVEIS